MGGPFVGFLTTNLYAIFAISMASKKLLQKLVTPFGNATEPRKM
jgi:hypothetical protein